MKKKFLGLLLVCAMSLVFCANVFAATETDSLTYYYDIESVSVEDAIANLVSGSQVYLSTTLSGEAIDFFSLDPSEWRDKGIDALLGLTSNYVEGPATIANGSSRTYLVDGYWTTTIIDQQNFDTCNGYLYVRSGNLYYCCMNGGVAQTSVCIYTVKSQDFTMDDVVVTYDDNGEPVVSIVIDGETVTTLDSSVYNFDTSGAVTVFTLTSASTGEYMELVTVTTTDADGNTVALSTDDLIDSLDYLTDDEKEAAKQAIEDAGSSAEDIQAAIDAAVAQNFVNEYLKENISDEDIYKEVNVDNKDQVYAGADAYDELSEAQQAAVDALIASYNTGEDEPQTYAEYLASATNYVVADEFIAEHLTGDDGVVYTETTIDNYADILGGEEDWNSKTQDEKDAINETLAAAGSQTYEELLAAAKNYETADVFIDEYLTSDDGDVYTETTIDNYGDVLAGEDDWNDMTDDEKAAVNEKLVAAGGVTYEELLEAAKNYETADGFIASYVSDDDGNIYTEATLDNYADILAGKDDWDNMTDEEKAAINEKLVAAGGMTYEELLAAAQDYATASDFIETYLTDSNGNIYTKVTADNYEAILASIDAWDKLTDAEKAAINEKLLAEIGMTYEELIAQAEALKAELESPKTGDSTMLSTLMVMTLLSLGAMLLAARKREED